MASVDIGDDDAVCTKVDSGPGNGRELVDVRADETGTEIVGKAGDEEPEASETDDAAGNGAAGNAAEGDDDEPDIGDGPAGEPDVEIIEAVHWTGDVNPGDIGAADTPATEEGRCIEVADDADAVFDEGESGDEATDRVGTEFGDVGRDEADDVTEVANPVGEVDDESDDDKETGDDTVCDDRDGGTETADAAGDGFDDWSEVGEEPAAVMETAPGDVEVGNDARDDDDAGSETGDAFVAADDDDEDEFVGSEDDFVGNDVVDVDETAVDVAAAADVIGEGAVAAEAECESQMSSTRPAVAPMTTTTARYTSSRHVSGTPAPRVRLDAASPRGRTNRNHPTRDFHPCGMCMSLTCEPHTRRNGPKATTSRFQQAGLSFPWDRVVAGGNDCIQCRDERVS